MTDGFIFYGSFMKALETLPDAERLAAYDAICRYALYDEQPTCDGAALGMFYMAQPQIDANRKRRENGMHGGRPKQNRTETKAEPNGNQTETKAEPKEKVKVKDKVKEKEIKHKYGAYKHVALTDAQYGDLLTKYGEVRLQNAIKRVDEYCEETGKTYKNYALVIQRWGANTPTQKNGAGKFANFPQRQDDANKALVAKLIAMQ